MIRVVLVSCCLTILFAGLASAEGGSRTVEVQSSVEGSEAEFTFTVGPDSPDHRVSMAGPLFVMAGSTLTIRTPAKLEVSVGVTELNLFAVDGSAGLSVVSPSPRAKEKAKAKVTAKGPAIRIRWDEHGTPVSISADQLTGSPNE